MHGDHRVNRLKLHEFEVLLAVAQAGSMAKAAAQLALSEPAVSRSISDMENFAGAESPPLTRSPRRRARVAFNVSRQRVVIVGGGFSGCRRHAPSLGLRSMS